MWFRHASHWRDMRYSTANSPAAGMIRASNASGSQAPSSIVRALAASAAVTESIFSTRPEKGSVRK